MKIVVVSAVNGKELSYEASSIEFFAEKWSSPRIVIDHKWGITSFDLIDLKSFIVTEAKEEKKTV